MHKVGVGEEEVVGVEGLVWVGVVQEGIFSVCDQTWLSLHSLTCILVGLKIPAQSLNSWQCCHLILW